MRHVRRLRQLPLILVAISVSHSQTIIDAARLGPFSKFFTVQPGDRPLECTVTPIKPTLNFSFHMQAGYVVRIPMRQFEGHGHAWLITFRVTPTGGDRKGVYFGDKVV